MNVILTFLIAGLSGLLFLRLKIPGGMMVGAILGTLLFSLGFHCAEVPYSTKFAAQCITGALIGCTMGREDVRHLKDVWRPALTVIIAFFCVDLVLGFGLFALGYMDLLTSLLSAIAGGMSEVALAASDMGADTSKVALLQFARLIYGVGIFPIWIAWLDRNNKEIAAISLEEKKEKTSPGNVLLLTVTTAFVCGSLGRISGIPSGVLMFAILGTLTLNLLVVPVRLPRAFRRIAQLFSGAYIGCSIPYEALYSLHMLLFPAAAFFCVYMLNAYLTGHFIKRRFGFPIREAMLMATPAGGSDIMLISADIGINSSTLVIIHLLRVLFSAAVMPQIVYLIAKIFASCS